MLYPLIWARLQAPAGGLVTKKHSDAGNRNPDCIHPAACTADLCPDSAELAGSQQFAGV